MKVDQKRGPNIVYMRPIFNSRTHMIYTEWAGYTSHPNTDQKKATFQTVSKQGQLSRITDIKQTEGCFIICKGSIFKENISLQCASAYQLNIKIHKTKMGRPTWDRISRQSINEDVIGLNTTINSMAIIYTINNFIQ